MPLIKLKGEVADKYKKYLQSYRKLTGKEPGPSERIEAFFCASSKNTWEMPTWMKLSTT